MINTIFFWTFEAEISEFVIFGNFYELLQILQSWGWVNVAIHTQLKNPQTLTLFQLMLLRYILQ